MSYLRLTTLVACLMGPVVAHAADGLVYVYLQPLPSDAERLAFSVASVSATNDRGIEVPLKLAFANIKPGDVRRQRLFASGRLPEGSYVRLSVTVQKASLQRDRDFAALLVPEGAVPVTAPFVVPRGRAVVLWLSLSAADSVADGATFRPTFSAVVPSRPIVGRAGFVSNSRSNTITVFDKQLRQVAAVIPMSGAPSGMALDQRAARLYVACKEEDEVRAIDVASAEVVEYSRLLPGDGPAEIALTPDGRTLMTVNTGSNSVSLFDAVPLTRQERIAVGTGPSSLAIDPAGRRAFIFNTLSNSISVVDVARSEVVATIATESAPLRGAFNARGDRLLVIHERSPYVTIVDPLQLTVTARSRLRNGIDAIEVDARRNLVYIGGRDDRRVEAYDPDTLLPVDSVRVAGGVSNLTIDAEDSSLYMVGPESGVLSIARVADRKGVAEIDVGEGAYWVSVAGEQ